jgi:hypothetical protein
LPPHGVNEGLVPGFGLCAAGRQFVVRQRRRHQKLMPDKLSQGLHYNALIALDPL